MRHRFDPWVGKIPWRRAWQPIPGFSFGKSHGQMSLVGYSAWGCKRVRHDWSDLACTHTHVKSHTLYIFFNSLALHTDCWTCLSIKIPTCQSVCWVKDWLTGIAIVQAAGNRHDHGRCPALPSPAGKDSGWFHSFLFTWLKMKGKPEELLQKKKRLKKFLA